MIRAIRVLEPCEAWVISDRRTHPPRDAAGADPGRPRRIRVNGSRRGAKFRVQLAAGDIVTIETPGGGRWGRR